MNMGGYSIHSDGSVTIYPPNTETVIGPIEIPKEKLDVITRGIIQGIQNRVEHRQEDQSEWRRKVIDLAIEALTEPTHRQRDLVCKELLKHLRNMPEIQDYDYNNSQDGLPF